VLICGCNYDYTKTSVIIRPADAPVNGPEMRPGARPALLLPIPVQTPDYAGQPAPGI